MIWYGVEPLVTHDPAAALSLASHSQIPTVRQFIYRRAAADADAINQLLTNLATVDDQATQKMMLSEIATAISQQGRLKMPQEWPEAYAKLAKSEDEIVREQAQLITVRFGDSSIFPTLRTIVADAQAKPSFRESALAALLSGKDQQLVPVMIGLLGENVLRGQAIRGLAGYADDSIPAAILDQYSGFDTDEKADAVATLASRASFAHRLLDAVQDGTVPRTDLSAFTVRQMSLLGDEQLVEKVNRVWGTMRSTPTEKKQRIAELKKQLGPRVLANADLSHGRTVFDNTCGKCHRLFGTGGEIGPDITGSNRADLDYSLQNMIDPNALIGKDYQATQLLTLDGRVITGLLKEENDTAVVIQTANEKLVVAKEDIEQRSLAANSVMPEGQLDQMKPEEVRDLVAYLASRTQVPRPGEGPVFGPNGRVIDAIEGETIEVLKTTGGNAAAQGMGGFRKGRWSDANHLWWTGAKVGDQLTVAIPAERAGDYEVYIAMTKAKDYGVFDLAINGEKTRQSIDLFNEPDVISTGPISLGTHALKAGVNELKVTVSGANPQAVKSFMFGLDYLYLATAKAPE